MRAGCADALIASRALKPSSTTLEVLWSVAEQAATEGIHGVITDPLVSGVRRQRF